MSMDRRLNRLELFASRDEEAPRHRVIVYTSGLSANCRAFTDEDREVALEITMERERRAGPRGMGHSVITPDDVDAWRDGRRAEAIRGIGHRDYGDHRMERS